MTSPRTALILSFLERYTAVVVYAVSNIVLSRVLTPHDTGLFTVGFVLTVMIGTFRDFGVSTYIIQEPDLTDAKWRSALGVSVITCAIVLAAVIAASFVAGEYYRDTDVTTVMLICSFTMLMIPLNSVVLAWFRRDMRYGHLYRVSLAGAVAQSLVTIALAWAGHGAFSMAWGSVANSVMVLGGSIHYRPRQFGYRPSLARWRDIAGLGVYSTVGTVCNEITPNGADLFIGRFGGLAALGQFSKGASLVSFVNQALVSAILPVTLSVFARKSRAGEPLGDAVLQGLTLFTGLTWPAYAGLGVIAYPAIYLLFGPQWNAAVPPARLIVVAAMITSLTAIHGVVYQAAGAMRGRMIVQIAVTPAQLAVLFLAAHGTLTQAAMGMIASAGIEFVVSQIMVNRICGTTMLGLLSALWPSAIVTICTSLGAIGAIALLPPEPDVLLLPFAAATATGTTGWLLGLRLSSHPLGTELVASLQAARVRLVLGRQPECCRENLQSDDQK